MKEFHAIIGNLFLVRKKAFIANEIEDPEVPGEIVYDPVRVRTLISKKYCQLFASDCNRAPFEVGYIEPITVNGMIEAAGVITTGKGIGMDYISDAVLELDNPELLLKLNALINYIFRVKRIPSPFNFSRLHLLNKLNECTE